MQHIYGDLISDKCLPFGNGKALQANNRKLRTKWLKRKSCMTHYFKINKLFMDYHQTINDRIAIFSDLDKNIIL